MTTKKPEKRKYQGRMRPKIETDAVESDFCAEIVAYEIKTRAPQRCERLTINGDQWCYDCKDMQDYAGRLKLARDVAMAAWEAAHPRIQSEQLTLV